MIGGRGPFAGWPAAAVALVDRAAERHGGWTRFAALSSVTLEFAELGGALPRMKGYGRTFGKPTRITVWPHECRVRLRRSRVREDDVIHSPVGADGREPTLGEDQDERNIDAGRRKDLAQRLG